jgi:hypothetical protein
MKRLVLLVAVSFCVANEPKIYGIKSGYIEYEHKSYYMHTELKIKNGKEEGIRKKVPFVDKKIYYYFDDYGNKVYEVAYQVSKFFGKKKIDPPKKLYEIVKKGSKSYYFKRGRVSINSWHLKEDCHAKKELCQKEGWYKALYPKAKEIAVKKVANKEAKCFTQSKYSDDCLWQNILLEQTFYSTSKGKRFEIEEQKTAIKVDTSKEIKSDIFNPSWLKEQK